MTVPKVTPSTAKLFSKKRMRRQVVVEQTQAEEVKSAEPSKAEVDKPADPVKMEPVAVEPQEPATVVANGPPPAFRRR